MTFKVVLMNGNYEVIYTKHMDASDVHELEAKIQTLIKDSKLLEKHEEIKYEASTIVLRSSVKRPPQTVEIDDTADYSEDIHCNECGESEKISFVATYASGDYWKCICGHGFHQ